VAERPATYGYAVVTGGFRGCEKPAVAMLRDMLEKRLAYQLSDGERYLDAFTNARLVADAERYYRIMYYGARESGMCAISTCSRPCRPCSPVSVLSRVRWCGAQLARRRRVGDGDGRARRAQRRQLCRTEYGDRAYLVGFGTDHGTVAAATDWDGPMAGEARAPAHAESYERLCTTPRGRRSCCRSVAGAHRGP